MKILAGEIPAVAANLRNRPGRRGPLELEPVLCCICEVDDAEPVGLGIDFEYGTSPDTFCAVKCRRCGLVYLNPRPTLAELARIYPADYHAFDFSTERFGLVYRVRRRLEARRLLSWCADLPANARILDVGCGDGFHLGLLAEFGQPGWTVEGVEPDERGAAAARKRGLTVHRGTLQSLDLPPVYDLVILIQTLEHVDDPPGVLAAIRECLRPGGRLVIVTDNTDTVDFRIFGGSYWGGYHFPRHWNLFDAGSLTALARKVDLEIEELGSQMSPVNWVYSLRNTLVDLRAPKWFSGRFSLQSPGSLAVFTIVDGLYELVGRGALLRAVLRRPAA